MKCVLIFSLSVLISSETLSQQLSVGVRAGVSKGFIVGKTTPGSACGVTSYVFDDERSYVYPAAKYTMNQSVFVRYQTRGRYAIELNVDHNRQKEQRKGTTTPVSNVPLQDYSTETREDFYSFSLFFQYDMGLNSLKKHKILGRFTPYLGVGVTQTYRTGLFRSEYSLNNTPTYISETLVTFQMSGSNINLNYLLNYRVSRHITLSALVLCGFNTSEINWRGSDFYFMPLPNARFSTNIGVSYGIY